MKRQVPRRIAHVDMDAFYAAVEQHDYPPYRGQPVIVGGLEPRGVVATASYEARTYGVHSAMPTSRARSLCPNGVFLSPRFDRYKEISEQVHRIMRSYTPIIEPISLDEAFLDLTACKADFAPAEKTLADMKRRIHQTTGLTCSAGLACSRFLAKLASELDKPDGLVVIRPEHAQAILDPLPVNMIWGVGSVTEERLRQLGITTIRDLRQTPVRLLRREFGAHGQSLYRLARGQDGSSVQAERETKSVSRELTLATDLSDPEQVAPVLAELAGQVSRDLRRQGLLGKTVRLKVRFANFDTMTRQVALVAHTDSAPQIEATAVDLYFTRVAPEFGQRPVRLLGVGLTRLSEKRFRQLPLFPPCITTQGVG